MLSNAGIGALFASCILGKPASSEVRIDACIAKRSMHSLGVYRCRQELSTLEAIEDASMVMILDFERKQLVVKRSFVRPQPRGRNVARRGQIRGVVFENLAQQAITLELRSECRRAIESLFERGDLGVDVSESLLQITKPLVGRMPSLGMLEATVARRKIGRILRLDRCFDSRFGVGHAFGRSENVLPLEIRALLAQATLVALEGRKFGQRRRVRPQSVASSFLGLRARARPLIHLALDQRQSCICNHACRCQRACIRLPRAGEITEQRRVLSKSFVEMLAPLVRARFDGAYSCEPMSEASGGDFSVGFFTTTFERGRRFGGDLQLDLCSSRQQDAAPPDGLEFAPLGCTVASELRLHFFACGFRARAATDRPRLESGADVAKRVGRGYELVPQHRLRRTEFRRRNEQPLRAQKRVAFGQEAWPPLNFRSKLGEVLGDEVRVRWIECDLHEEVSELEAVCEAENFVRRTLASVHVQLVGEELRIDSEPIQDLRPLALRDRGLHAKMITVQFEKSLFERDCAATNLTPPLRIDQRKIIEPERLFFRRCHADSEEHPLEIRTRAFHARSDHRVLLLTAGTDIEPKSERDDRHVTRGDVVRQLSDARLRLRAKELTLTRTQDREQQVQNRAFAAAVAQPQDRITRVSGSRKIEPHAVESGIAVTNALESCTYHLRHQRVSFFVTGAKSRNARIAS